MKILTLIFILLLSVFCTSYAVEWEEIKIKCDLKTDPTAVLQSGDTIYIGHYGIAKSTDGGKTFKHLNKVLDVDKVRDLQDIGLPVHSFYISEQGTVLAFVRNYGILYLEENDSIWHLSRPFMPINLLIYGFQFFEKDRILFFLCSFEYSLTNFYDNQKFEIYKSENQGKIWESIDYDENSWESISNIHLFKYDNTLAIYGKDKDSINTLSFFDPTSMSYESQYSVKAKLSNYIFIGKEIFSFSNSDKMIYVSNNKGKDWQKWQSILGKNDSLDCLILKKHYSVTMLNNHTSKLTLNLVNTATIYYEYIDVTFISDDKGKSWDLWDQQNPKYSDEPDSSNLLNYLVKEQKIGENEFPLVMNDYRKIGNSEIFSNYHHLYKKEDGQWKTISMANGDGYFYQNMNDIYYLNSDGSAYIIHNDSLYYVESFAENINSKNEDVFSCFPENTLHYLKYLDDRDHIKHRDNQIQISWQNSVLSRRKYQILFIKKRIIQNIPNNIDEIRDKENGDYVALCNYGRGDLQVIYGNYKKDKQRISSLNSNFVFSADIEYPYIAISDINGIKISQDTGKTWNTIVAPTKEMNIKIHNKEFYHFTRYALLRSSDGKYWDNLLEVTSQARIIGLNFDPDGYAYAYTTNGAYISNAPIKKFDRSWNEEDIDLQFKLSSNKKSVEITSQNKIINVAISDLGRELKQISDYTYDISNFDTANYFIRVEFEDGKVVYKQLLIVEPFVSTEVTLDVDQEKQIIKIISPKKISRIEAVEADDRLEQLTDDTYDISRLPCTRDFLKIEFEDEEVIYREFVKEEPEDLTLNIMVKEDNKSIKIECSKPIRRIETIESDTRLRKTSDSTFDISKLDYTKHTLQVEFEDRNIVLRELTRQEPKDLISKFELSEDKKTLYVQSSKIIKIIDAIGYYKDINKINDTTFDLSKLPKSNHLITIEFEDKKEGHIFREIDLTEDDYVK